MSVRCTCQKCGGTMIAGKMTRRGVVIGEFLLCFKCGFMTGKLEDKDEELV